MGTDELQILAWGLAISVIGLVSSWTFLVVQAFFHDKRIALTGVFSAALAALAMAVSTTVSYALLYGAGIACLGFLLWFIVLNFRKIPILAAVVVCLVSAAGAYWCYNELKRLEPAIRVDNATVSGDSKAAPKSAATID